MDFYRTRGAMPCHCGAMPPAAVLPAMPIADTAPGFSLAMAYVPRQQWGRVYDERAALEHGTIFPDLDMPFLAQRTRCTMGMGGNCR